MTLWCHTKTTIIYTSAIVHTLAGKKALNPDGNDFRNIGQLKPTTKAKIMGVARPGGRSHPDTIPSNSRSMGGGGRSHSETMGIMKVRKLAPQQRYSKIQLN